MGFVLHNIDLLAGAGSKARLFGRRAERDTLFDLAAEPFAGARSRFPAYPGKALAAIPGATTVIFRTGWLTARNQPDSAGEEGVRARPSGAW
jgi:hypothetical protein